MYSLKIDKIKESQEPNIKVFLFNIKFLSIFGRLAIPKRSIAVGYSLGKY